MCTELEEYRTSCVDDRAKRVLEEDRLTDVLVPISSVQLGSRDSGAGHGGEKRRSCRSRPNMAQAIHKLCFKLFHCRAVIWHVHSQRAAEYVRFVESLVDLAEHGSVTGECNRSGAVYRRD